MSELVSQNFIGSSRFDDVYYAVEGDPVCLAYMR